jgi:hypothetical protein
MNAGCVSRRLRATGKPFTAKGLPDKPVEDGFVFSVSEIDAGLRPSECRRRPETGARAFAKLEGWAHTSKQQRLGHPNEVQYVRTFQMGDHQA